jgi:hypothetical protein
VVSDDQDSGQFVNNLYLRIVSGLPAIQAQARKCQDWAKRECWLAAAGLQLAGEVILDNWTNGTIDLSKNPPEAHVVNTLPIVLPPTLEGCLEVFLANSLLAVSHHDKTIVEKSRELVAIIPDEPYLLKKRLRHKAALGSALSIMSPDWVFGDLDEKLRAVAWEEIQAVNAAYTRLGDL